MTVLALICVAVLVPRALACSGSVKELPELDRRSRTYQANDVAHDLLVDDFYLNKGWYDVNNIRGQFAIPDVQPKYGVCGTNNPIYLQSKHPDLAALSVTPTTAKVCMKDDFDDCATTFLIKIRVCDKKIQYYLVTTPQHSAYCFDPPELHNVGEIQPAPNGVALGDVKVIPELKFKEEEMVDRTKFDPYLVYRCSFKAQHQLFYIVTWYLNGKYFYERGPTDKIEFLSLQEGKLLESNVTMGFNLICGVRVTADTHGLATRMKSSQEFFAGLKVPVKVQLDKAGSMQVKIIQTVPIGCRYSTVSRTKTCSLKLSIADPDNYQCLKSNIVQVSPVQRCGLDLKALVKDEFWNPNGVEHNFTITTKDENYEDRKLYKLQLEISSLSGHRVWLGYSLGEIQVEVQNKKSYQERVCYAHIDPHMRTADGLYYEHQKEGTYMFYRNKNYGIMVQGKLVSCNEGKAWCICALGVRAGADIFIINLCEGTVKFIDFKTCKDGGILTVVKKTDTKYEIVTAIGTRIEAVFLLGNSLMNVDVTMAPKDIGKADGLCGFVDGDSRNDLTTRKRKIIPVREGSGNHYDEFSSDWKVADNENVFIKTTFDSWTDIYDYFCVCEQAFDASIQSRPSEEAVCSPSMDLNCKRDGTEKKRNCVKFMRKKRSVSLKKIREIDRKLRIMTDVKYSKVNKRQTIGQVEARNHCTNMINGSLAFTKYSNQTAGEDPNAVIDQCEFDVLAGSDLSWAGIHVDSLNTIVSKSFEFTPQYAVNNTDIVSYFKENSCPNNCSGIGNCNKDGKCECLQYFHGPQCEIDERVAPIITDTEGDGVCDLQDGDGCTCLSLSTEYLLQNFTCEIAGDIMYDNDEKDEIKPIRQRGIYEDIFTGRCCVPQSRRKRSLSDRNIFTVQYNLSISNNGMNFGNTESILVLDSLCQQSSGSQKGRPSVALKAGFCFINGICVSSKVSQVSNDCNVCSPEVSPRNWTNVCVKSSENSGMSRKKRLIIIGVTVGCGVAIGFILIAILVWKMKIKNSMKKKKSVGDSQTIIGLDRFPVESNRKP